MDMGVIHALKCSSHRELFNGIWVMGVGGQWRGLPQRRYSYPTFRKLIPDWNIAIEN
jgi:hypothetical protein